MAVTARRWTQELRYFWFEVMSPADVWRPSEALDNELRRRFGREWSALRLRPAHEFLGSPHEALAAVLLFDQIPRNIFRGSARTFASDPLARDITRGAIAKGFDRQLTRNERQFLYMPLMHSEDIADQRLSLRLFTRLGRGFGMPFARSHYRAVARFGRFPHRNDMLGRSSTATEEKAVANGMKW